METQIKSFFQQTRNVAKKSTGGILWMLLGGFLVLATGCEKLKNLRAGIEEGSLSEPQEIMPNEYLLDTKWKLVGIFDAETDTLIKELEPKDCEECYTLVFDTDSTFLTFSSVNEFKGDYIVDYEDYSFQIVDFMGTKRNEFGGGQLYVNPFWEKAIHSFTIKNTYPKILHLYYDDGKNCLKYKKIGGENEY